MEQEKFERKVNVAMMYNPEERLDMTQEEITKERKNSFFVDHIESVIVKPSKDNIDHLYDVIINETHIIHSVSYSKYVSILCNILYGYNINKPYVVEVS